jgi:hypothetical protein
LLLPLLLLLLLPISDLVISCARNVMRHASSTPSPVAAATIHDLQVLPLAVICNHHVHPIY